MKVSHLNFFVDERIIQRSYQNVKVHVLISRYLIYLNRISLNSNESIRLNQYLSLITLLLVCLGINCACRIHNYHLNPFFFALLNDWTCDFKNPWMQTSYCYTSAIYDRTFIKVQYRIIPCHYAIMKITYSRRI